MRLNIFPGICLGDLLLAVGAGAAAVVLAPVAVAAVGFGAGGIAAGSLAATAMSTAATTGYVTMTGLKGLRLSRACLVCK